MYRTGMKRAMAAVMGIALGAWLAQQDLAAQPQRTQQQVVIIADLHKDNPVRINEQYRQRIAARLRQEIQGLELRYGDWLILRTMGDASPARHADSLWNRDIRFRYRQAEPADLPGLINALMVRLSSLPAHESSRPGWALARLKGTLDCSQYKVTIFMVTNGLQAGTVRDGAFWMPDAAFKRAPLRGCSNAQVKFLGFAAQMPEDNPNIAQAAKQLFERLFRQAGLGRVDFVE